MTMMNATHEETREVEKVGEGDTTTNTREGVAGHQVRNAMLDKKKTIVADT